MLTKKRKIAKHRVSAAREIAYLGLSVALIAVCTFISLPLGEVPFTLQTFAVCLIGGLLGMRRGTAAVAVYLLMGLIGIPVFAGFKAGAAALFGVTGGYLFGFLLTAPIVGAAKSIPVKNKFARLGTFFAAMILGLAVCYLFGTLWFMFISGSNFGGAFAVCVLPFLIPDCIKLILAAALCVRLERYIKL